MFEAEMVTFQKFTGFHVFYYFTKLRNPAVVEAGLSGKYGICIVFAHVE